jgi:hypothetical protein
MDPKDLRERIRAMREEGMTLPARADQLNREGLPHPRGRWRPSRVQWELLGARDDGGGGGGDLAA